MHDLSVNSLFVTFLNESELIYLRAVKYFHVLLFIDCTQLNGFNYGYLPLIILLNIDNNPK